MPDVSLNTSKSPFPPSEEFVRFTRQVAEGQLRLQQQLAEPFLRLAAVVQWPLSEPQQHLVAQLIQLYRHAQQPAPTWLCQVAAQIAELQRSKGFERLTATVAQFGQFTSGVISRVPQLGAGSDALYLKHVDETRKQHGRWPTWAEDNKWRVPNGVGRDRLRALRKKHRPSSIKKRTGRPPSKPKPSMPTSSKISWRKLADKLAEVGG